MLCNEFKNNPGAPALAKLDLEWRQDKKPWSKFYWLRSWFNPENIRGFESLFETATSQYYYTGLNQYHAWTHSGIINV